MSYRIYLGNLDRSTTKENLEELFEKLNLAYQSILLKNGYAFIESPDQTSFDMTIDVLTAYNFMGSIINAEPSTVSKKRKGRKIQIKNLPSTYSKEDIEALVASKGKVQQCDIITSNVDSYVLVIYDSSDDAQKAITELNNFEFNGSVLQAEYFIRNDSRPSRQKTKVKASEMFSLRILVPSELIGAIIGRKGQTIQNITASTDVSRIDVHGKDNFNFAEKMIFITSQKMENITAACKEILKVIEKEMHDNDQGEPVLKILADDRHCGRLIGKEGKIIKKIRDDTDTKIAISDDMVMTFPDRVITIRGDSVDKMSEAEAAISLILKECIQKDNQQRVPMINGARMSHSNSSMMAMSRIYAPMMLRDRGSKSNQSNSIDTYYMSVPNAAVGAIIGTAGSNIKQIIRDSRAIIFIEGRSKEDASPSTERCITVRGTSDSFWKASFYVFEKMKMEGFAGNDEVRLRTLMPVPKALVGRIIGKGGKHARDVESATGAIIRITDDAKAKEDEAMLEVFGTFTSTLGAISRVRTVVSQVPPKSSQEGGDTQASN